MTDNQEQQLRDKLNASTDFLQRQQLLKALWKLQQQRENSSSQDARAPRAA